MSRRLTTVEFVERARVVHGNKYDYSKSEYVSKDKKLVIICPEHGEFLQSPNNHWKGKGCPVCSGNKKCNTDDFVEKAILVHGDKYDYSHVDYVNTDTNVTIICSEHGAFQQTPYHHLLGHGCPKCSVAKQQQTCMDKYGVLSYSQTDEFVEKVQNTCLQEYGVKNPMLVDEIKNRQQESVCKHYGVKHYLQLSEGKKKQEDTCLQQYGVKHALQNEIFAKRRLATCMNLYGVPFYSQTEKCKESVHDYFLQKFGVDHPMQLDELKQKMVANHLTIYGVENPMQRIDVKEKQLETKRLHGTFHTSEAEEKLYKKLCDFFGESDVKRQYKSQRYPFQCDFYVVSRDMFIELNASPMHNHHWFDIDNPCDLEERDTLLCKHTKYYDNVLETWTERDVLKRKTAKEYALNYLVFWDNRLRDTDFWFDMNCPNGHDYDYLYSWIPYDLSRTCPNKFTGSQLNISRFVRYYQFYVFYERELKLWYSNKYIKNEPLRIYLARNRYCYMDTHPTPNDLTTPMILRGFGISGLLRSYTVFDTKFMRQVIEKYHITSVYDPCAGWGERMLLCSHLDIRYTGVDVNTALQSGYVEMMSDFQMTKQNVLFGDSAQIHVDGTYDAVITCPPYGDTEVYSENGAENLSSDEFLKWWQCVVQNSLSLNIQYFCFQINQKWRHRMSVVVEACGFVLIDSFVSKNNKSSHFTRSKDGVNKKKEYEEMLVFRKL